MGGLHTSHSPRPEQSGSVTRKKETAPPLSALPYSQCTRWCRGANRNPPGPIGVLPPTPTPPDRGCRLWSNYLSVPTDVGRAPTDVGCGPTDVARQVPQELERSLRTFRVGLPGNPRPSRRAGEPPSTLCLPAEGALGIQSGGSLTQQNKPPARVAWESTRAPTEMKLELRRLASNRPRLGGNRLQNWRAIPTQKRNEKKSARLGTALDTVGRGLGLSASPDPRAGRR